MPKHIKGIRGSVKMEITGQKFNKLTVISFAGMDKGKSTWKCSCECGNETIVKGYRLMNGGCKSCGCLNKRNLHHGMRPRGKWKKFYKTWISMKERCFNKNNPNYFRYGGRGITVCKEWNKFENFHKDMFESFENHIKIHGDRETTIDRINNDLGYSFENCRWATHKIQSNNMRNNIRYNSL